MSILERLPERSRADPDRGGQPSDGGDSERSIASELLVSQYGEVVDVGDRIRPSLLRNVPVLAFCLGGGLFGVLADDVPAMVRVAGIMFVVAFLPFLLLLVTRTVRTTVELVWPETLS